MLKKWLNPFTVLGYRLKMGVFGKKMPYLCNASMLWLATEVPLISLISSPT